MNPLLDSFSDLKDYDLETKIADLSKKYFMTNNMQLKEQLISLINIYKEELTTRRLAVLQQENEKSIELNKLINVT